MDQTKCKPGIIMNVSNNDYYPPLKPLYLLYHLTKNHPNNQYEA